MGKLAGQVNKTTDQNSAKGWISDCNARFSPLHKMMQPGVAFLAYSVALLRRLQVAPACEISLPKSPEIAFPGSSCLMRDSPTRTYNRHNGGVISVRRERNTESQLSLVSVYRYLCLMAYRFDPSVLNERDIIRSEQRRFSYNLEH